VAFLLDESGSDLVDEAGSYLLDEGGWVVAKTGGLGDHFYVGGFDVSGDVNAVGQLGGGPPLLDVTAINKSANERIGGLRAADWQFTSFFEYTPAVSAPGFPATGVAVVSTYAYPVLVTIAAGTVTGVTVNGNSVGSADGTYLLPSLGSIAVTYTGSPTWTWVAVGGIHSALGTLPTADQIVTYFRGGALQSPAASISGKQINYDPTRDNAGNLTLAVEVQSDGYGMEWGEQLTAGVRQDTTATTSAAITDTAGTAFGAQAYVHLIGIIGTSATITISHCTTSGGSYTSLMATTAMASAGAQRLSVSNTTTVNRYLKVATSGTFTWAAFAVDFVRNPVAGQVF
jgi:hypothetical protein